MQNFRGAEHPAPPLHPAHLWPWAPAGGGGARSLALCPAGPMHSGGAPGNGGRGLQQNPSRPRAAALSSTSPLLPHPGQGWLLLVGVKATFARQSSGSRGPWCSLWRVCVLPWSNPGSQTCLSLSTLPPLGGAFSRASDASLEARRQVDFSWSPSPGGCQGHRAGH